MRPSPEGRVRKRESAAFGHAAAASRVAGGQILDGKGHVPDWLSPALSMFRTCIGSTFLSRGGTAGFGAGERVVDRWGRRLREEAIPGEADGEGGTDADRRHVEETRILSA